jgi:ABC-type transport system involved in multi-copper enzyme maturation permease subunit
MSIYKHDYRAYSGRVTPIWTRVLVLARYASAEAWASKVTVVLLVVCLLPFVGSFFTIYFANNPAARLLLGFAGSKMLTINANFFLGVLVAHSWLALVFASWITPRLITLDLADNALPILLSHPISRLGYIAGKYIAAITMLSLVTWIPCLLLFAYAGYSSPVPWAGSNLRVACGLLVGAVIWIGFLSLLGLALSSWVKWKAVATGTIFAAILVPASVGGIVDGVLRTHWGELLNLPMSMTFLWQRLLDVPSRMGQGDYLPTGAIVITLAVACGLLALMLNARIRARGVVRG